MQAYQHTARGHGVTAVLGPTNTGKTHLAIERMTAHSSGLIGLPLRLLAREVYNRVCDRVGSAHVSLITGEERIAPPKAKFQVCTVEAMPNQTDAEFVAIDEVQLATDLERGHFFTDRLLHLRGRHQTMLLGADTMTATLRELLPGIEIITRPRMSILTYAGSKKITRMPSRSAIVAFSADEVYAIAELIRRERGGAAVVTGSLSPRTRNAQVALYQNGDVDFLVATDAIGMGLNLDVDHVAFAQDMKFDGFQYRKLTAAEMGQIAGRAGRHTRDGTFGITSRVSPLPDELIDALENHQFQPAKVLTWRNRDLDFSSLRTLQESLEISPSHARLMKAPPLADIIALERLARDPDLAALMDGEEKIRLLWDVVKTPDYRRISPASHAEILARVYEDVATKGHIDETWFAAQVESADNSHGEIDALSTRIAHIRTWTYLSNRHDWLERAIYWRERTREVEDRLSDALHETLTKRFVDRRTSLLRKRLKENKMLEAEIGKDGAVKVEGHDVGHLKGFRFVPDGSGGAKDIKALNAAASKALADEISKRADRLAASPNSDIALSSDAILRWIGEPVAKLTGSDIPLRPKVIVLADEQLTGVSLEKVRARLERWVAHHVNTLLKPLSDLETDSELTGIAKGLAFRLIENLGIIPRRAVADDVKNLGQDMRATLRKNGVRFGAFNIYIPVLLKPGPSELICQLWAIANNKVGDPGMGEVPALSTAGRTSAPLDPEIEPDFYRLCGFQILGEKVVRIDILERLADLIRPTTLWKPNGGAAKPEGAIDGRSFYVTPAMLSILGATHDDMAMVLKGLGYREEKKPEAEIRPPNKEVDETGPTPNVSTTSASGETAGEAETKPAAQIEHMDTTVPNSGASSKVEPLQTATAQTVAVQAEAADAVADPASLPAQDDDDPKMISIWRYGGTGAGKGRDRNRGTHHQGRGNNNRNAKGTGNGKHSRKPQRGGKPADSNGNAKAAHMKKPPRQADPDSPFAKLAALKESLDGSK